MTALILAALLAAAPADAPLARPAIVIKEGQPAPYDGVLLDGQRTMEVANRLADADGKLLVAPATVVAAVAIVVSAVVAASAAAFVAGQNSVKKP